MVKDGGCVVVVVVDDGGVVVHITINQFVIPFSRQIYRQPSEYLNISTAYVDNFDCNC